MKILEAWVQKFLAWTKTFPVTKAKSEGLPLPQIPQTSYSNDY